MSASFNATTPDGWTTLQQSPIAIPAITAVAVATFIIFLYPVLSPQRKPTAIKELGGLSILTAWPFFTKRHGFLKSNFAKTGDELFTFKVLQHSVTASRGLGARKAFFDHKSLNFTEGYKILMGASPRLEDIDKSSNDGDERVPWFNKQLAILLNKRRLSEVIPTLFDDIQARMEGWGQNGRIDPFKNVYDLVFQMTVRMATCRELASDTNTLDRLQTLYWTLEKSSTPTSLLLPWFPGPAKKRKTAATKELFEILDGYVERRKAATTPSSDAIDLLLGQDLDNGAIIGFILSVIFAGVVNTGVNSCWTLLFLAHNKEWKTRVSNEVNSLITKHTDTTSSDPLHKRLAAIPISAWEDEMPILESVIRETLRITMNSTALRRNIVEDLPVSGKIIPRGNFMAYSLGDVHMNPDIYPNPSKFDPDRYSPGREEDKKVTFGYLGWGAGRHPCTGMKVAKLEIKMIIALFIAGYEYEVVDSNGNFPALLVKPNYDDIFQARPIGEACYLQFNRIVA